LGFIQSWNHVIFYCLTQNQNKFMHLIACCNPFRDIGIGKTLLIMKFTAIFLLAVCLNAAANGYAQRVSVSEKNVSLEKVFREIERQTDYTFAYTKLHLKKAKPVTITISNAPIEKVLDLCLLDQPFTYTIVNKIVVITDKKEKVLEKELSVASPPVQIQGKVTNENGEPLAGANIAEKGTNNATMSAADGSFGITVASTGAVLVVSYVGYGTKEVSVGNQRTINISLSLANARLNEIVVVGYGSQKRGNITGAVGTVSEEAFENRPNTQLGSVLQGKTAGVQVIAPSGKPSSGISIRVRGTSSINASSDPLYVVDGVPTTDTRSLNPGDIESVTVLKDASSAAIYGAQGANGVVLITTKRGKSGEPKFELDVYRGYTSVWKKLDMLNGAQYRALMTELGRNTDWNKYTANSNWQDEVFQNGTSQNYQLSLSGKNDKTTYYISGGWVQQKGAVRSSEMDRYNFKVNLEQKIKNWLTIGTNLAYTRYHDVDVSDNQAVNQGGVILGVLSTPPVIGIYNEDGTFTSNPFQNWENPIAGTDGSERGYKNQRLLGNVYGEISILPELKFRSNLGTDYSNAAYDYFLDPIRTSYGRATGGIGQYNTNLSNYWIIDNTLTYNKRFSGHSFSALGGMVAQKNRWENSYIEKRNFSGIGVITPNAGAVIQSANADKSEKTNASFISRVTYDFIGKYLVTANFRADASSNFGPGNKWGYFPSFSAGWRISQENFFKGVSFINDLKLRAGWGIVGNDNVRNYAYFGSVVVGANYPIGGVIQPGSSPSTIQNDDLKWEETEQANIGLDVSILKSRITFSADAYLKKTKDLLLNVPLPRSTGFDVGLQNAGSLENKGLEFQVSSKNLVRTLQWETDFNISFNRNKVTNLVGQTLFAGSVAGRGDVSYTTEGQPIGQFYGYVADIVDPATGNLLYINSKGNSTFNPAATDRVVIGNPNPDFIYGLTNTFTYKNLGLSIFVQGSEGNDIFNATRIETEAMIDPKNQSIAVLRRWTTPGQVTDIPKAQADNTNNSRISTRFVEDGSYLRIKSATLSYALPGGLLKKAHLGSAKLYVTGENLLTFTDYKGFDPEVNFQGGSNTVQGVDFGTYPQTRNFILGLNITF
jgi:TonB-dependent starch-binding outer membrane protein SusC